MKQKTKISRRKRGIKYLLLLYGLLGIIYFVRKTALAPPVSSVPIFSANILQKDRPAAGPPPSDSRLTSGLSPDNNDDNKEIKKIALTFDDGPHPIYTEQILDGLKARDTKATFFITGSHAADYPEIVKRIHEDGHTIGNHTYSHLQLTCTNKKQFAQELKDTNKIIREITGEETIFVRPPYGEWNKQLEKDLNLFPVLWTIDPLDWCRSDASCIVAAVLNKARENDIILLHDEYESTKIAAMEIVDRLTAEGYEFVTVEEILFN